MAFLDDKGLEILINKIQSGTIQSHTYTNLSAPAGTYIFNGFKIKTKMASEPWIVKYRITVEIPTDPNSKQIAEVMIAGFGNKLANYQTNNIIYDTKRRAVTDNTVALSKTTYEDTIVGVYAGYRCTEPHNMTVEILGVYGCYITFYDHSISKYYESYKYEIKNINFYQNGIFRNEEQEALTQDKVSAVALSGNYEDLFNKPDLLGVVSDEDEENLIFFY